MGYRIKRMTLVDHAHAVRLPIELSTWWNLPTTRAAVTLRTW